MRLGPGGPRLSAGWGAVQAAGEAETGTGRPERRSPARTPTALCCDCMLNTALDQCAQAALQEVGQLPTRRPPGA